MENKKTITRNLTMPKESWNKLDKLAQKYGYVSTQEVIRYFLSAILKEESPD